MAESVTLVGALAAVVSREYSFKDKLDGRKVEGIARAAWVCPSLEADPVVVKLRQDQGEEFHALLTAGFGAQVEMVVELSAQATVGGGARIERRLAQLIVCEPVEWVESQPAAA